MPVLRASLSVAGPATIFDFSLFSLSLCASRRMWCHGEGVGTDPVICRSAAFLGERAWNLNWTELWNLEGRHLAEAEPNRTDPVSREDWGWLSIHSTHNCGWTSSRLFLMPLAEGKSILL